MDRHPNPACGLTLNASTGLISGTPTGGGSGSFTFKVTDAAGNSATQTLTITVDPPLVALSVTTASLPGAGLAWHIAKRYRPPVVSHPTNGALRGEVCPPA